ncbi:hypothetical protein AOLI_G00080180 [Acnodon oligacanthus]
MRQALEELTAGVGVKQAGGPNPNKPPLFDPGSQVVSGWYSGRAGDCQQMLTTPECLADTLVQNDDRSALLSTLRLSLSQYRQGRATAEN